jgi:hypothetical protein
MTSREPHRKIQLRPPREDWPKHCGASMDPEPGDGIYECRKCPKWVHFPRGLPEGVRGKDLEKFTVAYNQLFD